MGSFDDCFLSDLDALDEMHQPWRVGSGSPSIHHQLVHHFRFFPALIKLHNSFIFMIFWSFNNKLLDRSTFWKVSSHTTRWRSLQELQVLSDKSLMSNERDLRFGIIANEIILLRLHFAVFSLKHRNTRLNNCWAPVVFFLIREGENIQINSK